MQHSIGPQTASRVMPSFTFPCLLAMTPAQRPHSCFVPTTRQGAPFPAGLRSLATQMGVVLQPSHFVAAGASGFSAGFGAGRFQNSGPGPASAAVAKIPLTIIPTELRMSCRVVFMVDLFHQPLPPTGKFPLGRYCAWLGETCALLALSDVRIARAKKSQLPGDNWPPSN